MNKVKYLLLCSIPFTCIHLGCHEIHCTPEHDSTSWIEGKEIIVTLDSEFQRNQYDTIKGPYLLFRYSHTNRECEEIVDDEWNEKLIFMVPDSVTEFNFSDSLVLKTHCFYQQTGAWVRHNQYPIVSGVIKGNKLSEKEWEVRVDVFTKSLFIYEDSKHIEFDRTFTK